MQSGPKVSRAEGTHNAWSLRKLLRTLGVLVSFGPTTAALLAAQALSPTHIDDFTGKPRVIISDIGNEPDDQMSLVRLLLYSNELDIEGLIPTTSTWQKTATHPETMHALIEAYGKVRSNLLLNAKGWPEAAELDSRVFPSQDSPRHGCHRSRQDVSGSAGYPPHC